ncbi:VanW family protein [Desulforamulus ruminis]|uniref:VanW family protein n=1 Tax=Desulforamulus ruminis (strain ATCC 23193 / DSM 2154 / NCIMB 8452 / DL) TaxID=696281 RepID=F6DSJ9_DESRL|nr:VanW family protein [Desulforamulus ruminis]AEG61089.1 VanW family protein [Desulforamulus ruminis DSM 2154]
MKKLLHSRPIKMTCVIFLFTFSLFQPTTLFAETTSPIEKEERGVFAEDIYNQFKGMDQTYEGPLPWENEQVFLEGMQKNNTPIKMAAYKAALHDPLPGEEYNIGLAASKLAGTVIKAGAVFSQNQTLGPYTQSKGYQAGPTYAGSKVTTTVGGGVCKIASLLYNVATLSDLQIIMRYPHSMTVPYVPPGQDATVFCGVKDLRFLNDTGGSVMIWSQKVGNTVYMALYGTKKPPKVTWHHRVLKRHNYWFTEKLNPNLPSGEEKIALPGQEGLIVRSWVTVEYPDKTKLTKNRGMSWYSASPCIIEHGPLKK